MEGRRKRQTRARDSPGGRSWPGRSVGSRIAGTKQTVGLGASIGRPVVCLPDPVWFLSGHLREHIVKPGRSTINSPIPPPPPPPLTYSHRENHNQPRNHRFVSFSSSRFRPWYHTVCNPPFRFIVSSLPRFSDLRRGLHPFQERVGGGGKICERRNDPNGRETYPGNPAFIEHREEG